MQRAGSTLQFQLTAHLVEAAGRGRRMEWAAPDQLPPVLRQHERSRDLLIVKTHVFTDAIEAQFRTGYAFGIYCYRDIRDVIVSIIQKESKPFDPVWVADRVASNLKWYDQWTRQPRMLVSRYETLIADVPAEVERIAAHLGLPLEAGQAESVAAAYTPDQQRQRMAAAKTGSFDPHSLLHHNHLSESAGQPGGWRSTLTPSQAAFIARPEIAGDWLLALGYLDGSNGRGA
jgi:hypothetical protein